MRMPNYLTSVAETPNGAFRKHTYIPSPNIRGSRPECSVTGRILIIRSIDRFYR